MQHEAVLQHSERQNRFLAEVSAALVGSLHYQSILRGVAELTLPTLGDFCFFDVLTDEAKIERVAWKHIDPAKEQLLTKARNLVPSAASDSHPASKVLRTGQPELVVEVTDAWLQAIASSDEYLDLLRGLSICSMLAVPIQIGQRRLGALVFAHSESNRRHTSDDLDLAVELARRLALMMENSKLFNQLRAADRKKNEFLAVLCTNCETRWLRLRMPWN